MNLTLVFIGTIGHCLLAYIGGSMQMVYIILVWIYLSIYFVLVSILNGGNGARKENKMVNIEVVNIEETVGDFIRDLQWDLRASYNSSSCLGSKQRDFLKEKLYDLLIVLQEERKE